LVLHDTGKSVDGLSAGEDGVSRLSFSPVDAYVLLGRYGDAYEPFERLLALRNDVGLLAEEYDAHDRRARSKAGRNLGSEPNRALAQRPRGVATVGDRNDAKYRSFAGGLANGSKRPEGDLQVGLVNGRNAPESGQWAYGSLAPRATARR
jgi:hypothetical protein